MANQNSTFEKDIENTVHQVMEGTGKSKAVKVKIKDIAARAGVSTGTVDRVIHNRGRVSDKTRAQVLQAMKELQYKPDILARTLARKDESLIRALIPYPYQDSYWKIVRNGIEKGLAEFSPYRVYGQINFYDMNDSMHFEKMGDEILHDPPDVVLLGSEFHRQSIDLLKACHQHRIPCIVLNAEINSVPTLSFIGINSYAVGELAGRIIRQTRGCSSVLVVHTTTNIENTIHLKNKELGIRSALNQASPDFQVHQLSIGNEFRKKEAIQFIAHEVIKHGINTLYFSTSRAYQYAPMLKKRFPHLYIIGHDVFDQHVKLMKNGTIDILIDQSGYQMGYQGIRSWADYYIHDRPIPPTQYLPLEIIYPENLPFFALNHP